MTMMNDEESGNMELMKTTFPTFILIVLSALMTSCGNQYIVNDIKLVQTVGYDIIQNGVQNAAIIANYEEQGAKKLEFYVTNSDNMFDSIPRLKTKLDFPLEYGQLRLALFGETFARKGIKATIDSLIRNPRISRRMQFGVADRDALNILNIPQNKSDPYFLSDMIEQNYKKGNLPLTNLHVVNFNLYGKGRDLFLPYITEEGREVKVNGIVLFEGDKFKTTISIRDALLLKMLLGNSKFGSITIPIKESNQKQEDSFLMYSIGSKSKFKVISIGPPASVAIHLELDALVRDVPPWMDLTSKDQISTLEKRMEAYFEKEIQKLVSFCKKNNVDPVGFGDLIRSRSNKWNAREFQEHYGELETTVSAKVKIVQTGSS